MQHHDIARPPFANVLSQSMVKIVDKYIPRPLLYLATFHIYFTQYDKTLP